MPSLKRNKRPRRPVIVKARVALPPLPLSITQQKSGRRACNLLRSARPTSLVGSGSRPEVYDCFRRPQEGRLLSPTEHNPSFRRKNTISGGARTLLREYEWCAHLEIVSVAVAPCQ